MATDPLVPTGKVVQFDREKYQMLINYMNAICGDLTKWMTSNPKNRLLPVLNGDIPVDPGSASWVPAANLSKQVKGFAGSVFTVNQGLLTDFRTFVANLNKAIAIFEETDDLATYSAQQFYNKFPDLVPASAGSPPAPDK